MFLCVHAVRSDHRWAIVCWGNAGGQIWHSFIKPWDGEHMLKHTEWLAHVFSSPRFRSVSADDEEEDYVFPLQLTRFLSVLVDVSLFIMSSAVITLPSASSCLQFVLVILSVMPSSCLLLSHWKSSALQETVGLNYHHEYSLVNKLT